LTINEYKKISINVRKDSALSIWTNIKVIIFQFFCLTSQAENLNTYASHKIQRGKMTAVADFSKLREEKVTVLFSEVAKRRWLRNE
jgi:hypothetical protein